MPDGVTSVEVVSPTTRTVSVTPAGAIFAWNSVGSPRLIVSGLADRGEPAQLEADFVLPGRQAAQHVVAARAGDGDALALQRGRGDGDRDARQREAARVDDRSLQACRSAVPVRGRQAGREQQSRAEKEDASAHDLEISLKRSHAAATRSQRSRSARKMPARVVPRSSVQVLTTLDLSAVRGARRDAVARGIQTTGLPSITFVTRS